MSNIDEKAKNNFTIEMRIFENYEKVKYEIIKAIDFLEHSGTAMGMCKIFDNQNHECQGCFYSLAPLCVVSWYALNVCRNFCVCSRLF